MMKYNIIDFFDYFLDINFNWNLFTATPIFVFLSGDSTKKTESRLSRRKLFQKAALLLVRYVLHRN